MGELFTELSTGAALLVAAWALYDAHKARKYASDCLTWVSEANKRSVALKQIGELSADVTDLRDLYGSLLDSHKKLRSRIGMRELREKRQDESTANGADLGAMNDKAELRLQAKQRGLLR